MKRGLLDNIMFRRQSHTAVPLERSWKLYHGLTEDFWVKLFRQKCSEVVDGCSSTKSHVIERKGLCLLTYSATDYAIYTLFQHYLQINKIIIRKLESDVGLYGISQNYFIYVGIYKYAYVICSKNVKGIKSRE